MQHATNTTTQHANTTTNDKLHKLQTATVLHYLRARATASDALFLPADDAARAALVAEARYFVLPGLEAALEAPAARAGEFSSVYKRQSSALENFIEAQPFAAIKQLLFDILLGQRELKSAWNPSLDQGTIMVRLRRGARVLAITRAAALGRA